MAFVYLLFSESLNWFYIGHADLLPKERLKKDLTDHGGFTAKTKDWKVVYQKDYGTKALAYAEERSSALHAQDRQEAAQDRARPGQGGRIGTAAFP